MTAPSALEVARWIRVLEHEAAYRRIAAAKALANLEDGRAEAPLGRVLQRDGDWSVREAAATALGRLDGPEGGEALVRALRDGEPPVRRASLPRRYAGATSVRACEWRCCTTGR